MRRSKKQRQLLKRGFTVTFQLSKTLDKPKQIFTPELFEWSQLLNERIEAALFLIAETLHIFPLKDVH